jgi:hypothetical protein
MGAETFINFCEGKNVKDAFNIALEKALYEHGHRGYTGSLAEKDSYVEIKIPKSFLPDEKDPKARALAWANKLIDDQDDRIDDKWGPAGISFVKDLGGQNLFIIYGWASS